MGFSSAPKVLSLRRPGRLLILLGPALLSLPAGCTNMQTHSQPPVGPIVRGSFHSIKELPNVPKQSSQTEALPAPKDPKLPERPNEPKQSPQQETLAAP